MNLRKFFRRGKKLDFSTLDASVYFKQDDETKRTICQKLKIYNPDHFGIFVEAGRRFADKFRFVQGIEASQCDLAPILGPSNCIKVFVPRHATKVMLPRYFEGFPVIRINEHNTPTYRNMVDRIKNKTESA